MADTRISELPEVTVPNSTDVLPIVSGGVTSRIQFSNLLASENLWDRSALTLVPHNAGDSLTITPIYGGSDTTSKLHLYSTSNAVPASSSTLANSSDIYLHVGKGVFFQHSLGQISLELDATEQAGDNWSSYTQIIFNSEGYNPATQAPDAFIQTHHLDGGSGNLHRHWQVKTANAARSEGVSRFNIQYLQDIALTSFTGSYLQLQGDPSCILDVPWFEIQATTAQQTGLYISRESTYAEPSGGLDRPLENIVNNKATNNVWALLRIHNAAAAPSTLPLYVIQSAANGAWAAYFLREAVGASGRPIVEIVSSAANDTQNALEVGFTQATATGAGLLINNPGTGNDITANNFTLKNGVLTAKNVGSVRYADKYASIQAAINDLPATGGVVFVPEGTYTQTVTIAVPSNVTLCGSGPMTIIKTGDAAEVHLITLDAGASNVTIHDIQFDGNGANQSTNVNIITTAGTGTESNIRIENCLFKDAKYEAINFDDTDNSWIVNNKFTGGLYLPIRLHSTDKVKCLGNEIVTTGSVYAGITVDGRNNLIQGNSITVDYANIPCVRVQADGAYLVRDNKIIGNSFIGASKVGQGVNITGAYTSNNVVSGNSFYDLDKAISNQAPQTAVSGNTIQTVGRAIECSVEVTSGTILGNSIYDFDDGIHFYGTTRVGIIGNTFSTGTQAFIEASAADYNSFIGNTLLTVTSPVTIIGTNTEFGHNIGY